MSAYIHTNGHRMWSNSIGFQCIDCHVWGINAAFAACCSTGAQIVHPWGLPMPAPELPPEPVTPTCVPPGCECGAAKTSGLKPFEAGHADYCPVKA